MKPEEQHVAVWRVNVGNRLHNDHGVTSGRTQCQRGSHGQWLIAEIDCIQSQSHYRLPEREPDLTEPAGVTRNGKRPDIRRRMHIER